MTLEVKRMKKSILYCVACVMALTSCSSAFQTASIGGDLYSIHNRTEIALRQKAEAEAARAEAEARQAALEAKIAEARAAAAAGEYAYYNEQSVNPYDLVLADTYESAYARRLFGFESPSYRMPSSYYSYRYSDAYHYASAYDPAFYNVMISGDQIWVEPKYITSMFGSWGASVALPTYSWYYGWGPTYSSWWYGYPRYSWYDWNWRCSWWGGYNYGWGYDPFWGYGFGYGYYPHYYPHYHPHHYPHHYPGYHPPHYGGDGGGAHRQQVVRRQVGPSLGGQSAGPRYPQQGTVSSSSGTGGIRRVGGTVTGSGQYRGSQSGTTSGSQYRGSGSSSQYRGSSSLSSSSGTRTGSSFNQRSESNSMSHSGSRFGGSSSSGGYSGGYSGGGNSSGGSHGGGQVRR